MKSVSPHRAIAQGLCSVLHTMLPKHRQGWADALRAEIAEIADDGEALRFALGGVFGLMPAILLTRLHAGLVALTGSGPSGRPAAMRAGQSCS